MSPRQRHIISKNNQTYEESHAISEPTNTAFISKEIMETNAEKKSVRQASEVVYDEPKLA